LRLFCRPSGSPPSRCGVRKNIPPPPALCQALFSFFLKIPVFFRQIVFYFVTSKYPSVLVARHCLFYPPREFIKCARVIFDMEKIEFGLLADFRHCFSEGPARPRRGFAVQTREILPCAFAHALPVAGIGRDAERVFLPAKIPEAYAAALESPVFVQPRRNKKPPGLFYSTFFCVFLCYNKTIRGTRYERKYR